MWEFTQRHYIELKDSDQVLPRPLREHDRSLMDIFINDKKHMASDMPQLLDKLSVNTFYFGFLFL